MPDMAYLKVGDTSYKLKDITAQNGIGDINQAIRDLPQIREAVSTNTTNISHLQTATQDLPQLRGKVTTLEENTADLPEIRQDVEQNANDISDLKSAIAKNTIYDSASGSIASFPDGADDEPLKELIVNVDPVQDLHGYSSPWPGGGGKNLAYLEQGTLNLATGLEEASTTRVRTDFIPIEQGTQYIASSQNNGWTIRNGVGYDANKGYVKNGIYPALSTGLFTVNDSSISYVRFIYSHADDSEACTPSDYWYQFEKGSTATYYEPYENICPISGWTQAKVTRAGKNLFDKTIGKNQNKLRDDNGIKQTTLSSSYTEDIAGIKPNTAYTISGTITEPSGTGRIYFLDAYHNWISRTASIPQSLMPYTFTTPAGCRFIAVQYNNGVSALDNVQIEESSIATAYESYKGNTYDIVFPTEAGTVYGGTLTVNCDGTVKMIINKWMYVFTGSEVWRVGSVANRFSCTISSYLTYPCYDTPITPNSVQNIISSIFGQFIYKNENNVCYTFRNGDGTTIVINTTLASTVSEVSNLFSGTQMLYEMETPIEYTLTAQQINTLLGLNNIWADTGDIEVTYPADLKLYIDKKVAG